VQCMSIALVGEIATLGGEVSGMVNPIVAQRLRQATAAQAS